VARLREKGVVWHRVGGEDPSVFGVNDGGACAFGAQIGGKNDRPSPVGCKDCCGSCDEKITECQSAHVAVGVLAQQLHRRSTLDRCSTRRFDECRLVGLGYFLKLEKSAARKIIP
jgi:hypothetical protein